MKIIFVCIFITIATASRNHHHFIGLNNGDLTSTGFGDLAENNGFYTIIHNGGDNSASQHHLTSEGLSSNGLHSLGDTSSGLETTTAESTIDLNRAPEPVTDTPEVEMARQAHFEAYREAALMAALAPDTDTEAEEAAANADVGGIGSSENTLTAEQFNELQQNTRLLLLNRQKTRKQLLDQQRPSTNLEKVGQEIGAQQQQQLITTYILTAKAEAHALAAGGQAQIEQPSRLELERIGHLSEELESGYGHENGNGNGNGNGNHHTNGNGAGNRNESGNGNTNGNRHANGNGNAKGGNGNGHANGNGNAKGNGNGHPNANGNGHANGIGNGNNGRINGNGNGNSIRNGHSSLENGNGHRIINGHNGHSSSLNGHSNGFSNNVENIQIPFSIHTFAPDEPLAIANTADIDTTYYTVDTPDTHYTVVIPPTTILNTLPQLESIRVGDHIISDASLSSAQPISKSFTYITKRLKSSTA